MQPDPDGQMLSVNVKTMIARNTHEKGIPIYMGVSDEHVRDMCVGTFPQSICCLLKKIF